MKILDDTFIKNKYIAICIDPMKQAIIDERIINVDDDDKADTVVNEMNKRGNKVWHLFQITDCRIVN